MAFATARCSLHGPVVEGLKAFGAALHVAESAQPHESIRVIEVAELADHLQAECLLRFDELAIEEIDEDVALAGMQDVLAQLDNRRETYISVVENGHRHQSSAMGEHRQRLAGSGHALAAVSSSIEVRSTPPEPPTPMCSVAGSTASSMAP